MKLALMDGAVGKLVESGELPSLGFRAVQVFFGHGPDGAADDPDPDALGARLHEESVALAAMTLHVDLVGAQGARPEDVARAVACVTKTAELDRYFGADVQPLLIWHPSRYPEGDAADLDDVVFDGLCDALGEVTRIAERHGVVIAVEITRAGSIGSAEGFLRVRDRVGSPALQVCMDAANFTPDRTPLERAVRMLGRETAIVHGKDVRFDETGYVADYGPTGAGTLDYDAYMRYVGEYVMAPYFVLEYYRTRADLLRARDIVRDRMSS